MPTPVQPSQDWPRWRGPNGDGVAPEANPPIHWSETSHVRWKTRLPGRGMSTPVIWGNQVFLQTAIPTGRKTEAGGGVPVPKSEPAPSRASRGSGGFRIQEPTEIHQFVVLSVDRRTGRILWQRTLREEKPHEGHHSDHGYASASPVTDGQRLFVFFGSRGLFCLDLEGNLQWQKDLGRMQTRNAFGEGSSPALHGQTVVVNWDHEGDDFIVALDAQTGQEKWRQPRDEPSSWSTPLVIEHAGPPQVVVSATSLARSYDLASGRLLWECSGLTANVVPSPVYGHGLVYLTSGFRGNALFALRPETRGNLTGTKALAWSHGRHTPYVPSPLLYGDLLYFLSSNNAVLSCHDARSGAPHYEAERLPGVFGVYASPLGAAGRVYIAGRDGKTVVLRHAPKLEILATNSLDEKFDASPAAVGKELFLRGHHYLYCLAE